MVRYPMREFLTIDIPPMFELAAGNEAIPSAAVLPVAHCLAPPDGQCKVGIGTEKLYAAINRKRTNKVDTSEHDVEFGARLP